MKLFRKRKADEPHNVDMPRVTDAEAAGITARVLADWRTRSFDDLRRHAGRPWTSWEIGDAGSACTAAVVVRLTDDPGTLRVTVGAGPQGDYPDASSSRLWAVSADGHWSELPLGEVDWKPEHPRGLELEAFHIAQETSREFASRSYSTLGHWASHGFHASSLMGASGAAWTCAVTAHWDDGPGSALSVYLELSVELAESYWSEPLAFAAFVKHPSGNVDGAEVWSRQDNDEPGRPVVVRSTPGTHRR
jgi:hypothetical protein